MAFETKETWSLPLPSMPLLSLTKRELFAAMAMGGYRHERSMYSPAIVAEWAVRVADALLAELAKPTDDTNNMTNEELAV